MTYRVHRFAAGLLSIAVLALHGNAQPPLATLAGGAGGKALLGDVDGDGRRDMVVIGTAAATVYSGASGAALYTVNAPSAMDFFGFDLAALGDVDADGIGDFMVSAPQQSPQNGYVVVYSGANGAVIRTLNGASSGDRYGESVADVGDVDQDGVNDIAVGAPSLNGDIGRVYVHSGATGSILFTADGPTPSGNSPKYGSSLAAPGDVDQDGVPDIAAGAPSHSLFFGFVETVSGATGSSIMSTIGPAPGTRTGTDMTSPGDLDGDGVGDLVVGAPAGTPLTQPSTVVMSGADLSVITVLTQGPVTGSFGYRVASLGDVDADGVADFAAGDPFAGDQWIYAGATRTVIASFTSANSFAGAGDWDGDGLGDVAVSTNAVASTDILPLPLLYRGTREDLLLLTGNPGAETGYPLVKSVVGGVGQLGLRVVMPGGGFVGAVPFLAVTPFPTGTPLTFATPPVFIDWANHVVILDGTATSGVLGPTQLGLQGLAFQFSLPAALSGQSLLFQCGALSTQANNGIFAATHGHEVQVQ